MLPLFRLIAKRLSMRLIIVQTWRALVGICLRLWLYVYLSVTGLQLKYMGLRIVYIPLLHVPLMMPLRWEIEVEDRRWCQNESRCMEDDSLLNKRMKDDKIMVTRNDLRVTTRVIYFACWPVNGIGGGQHGFVLTALRASPFHVRSNFPRAPREAHDAHVYT